MLEINQSSVHWLCEYVKERITNYNPDKEAQFQKAIGEFALLSFLVNRSARFPAQSRKEIQDTCLEILQRMNDLIPLFKDERAEGKYSANALLLGKSLNQNTAPYAVKIQKELNLQLFGDGLSLEQAYFMHLSGKALDPDFWKNAAVEISNFIYSNGLMEDWIYKLTHLVFFSTDFGSQNPVYEKKEIIDSIVQDLLWKSCDFLIENKKWDLFIEVLLSIKYLKKIEECGIKSYLSMLNIVFSESKSLSGWFMTQGAQSSFTLDSKIHKDDLYCIFHTTVVGVLLELELVKEGLDKEFNLIYSNENYNKIDNRLDFFKV